MEEEKKFSSKIITHLSLKKAYAKEIGSPLIFITLGERELIDDSILESVSKEMNTNLLNVQAADEFVLYFQSMLDSLDWLKQHPISLFPFYASAFSSNGDYVADNSNKEELSFITKHLQTLEKVEKKEEQNV